MKIHPLSIFFAAALLAAVAAIYLMFYHPEQPANRGTTAQILPAKAMSNPVSPTTLTPTNAASSTAAKTGVLPNYPDFKERPFPVAQESINAQWTLADGKDTNVIRQLAHNPLEYDRMVEENGRIIRRQLVYRKETAAAVIERAMLANERVSELILPGLDGQELKFEISKSDTHSSRHGTFSGHLEGDALSMVTLAFQDGREAFTIVSPAKGIYLQAFPREPGQVIITSFDPDSYLPLPGGEPIRTTRK
jgi:hypothetical protein